MSKQSDKANENTNIIFTCDYPGCGRFFRTKFSMKRHTLVHNDVKPYSCKYCGKRFSLPQYMKEHTYTHTKDKPYVCGVAGCQKSFRQAGKLSLHRRTHDEYVLKQYDCTPGHIKPVTSPINPPEDSKEKIEENRIHEVKPLPPVEEPLAEKKVEGKENSRPLWRQDSGQTAVSMQANDDVAALKEAGEDKFAIPEPKIANSATGPRLTKELLEMHDKLIEEGEVLINYLSFIDSPLSLSLRPVLPLPKGVTKKAQGEQLIIPNLFELIQRQTKE